MRPSLIAVVLLLLAAPLAAETIPSPSEFLGMPIGGDRVLADYHQITRYFRMLDERSDRVAIESLGTTTLGNDMIMAVITSSENHARIDQIRDRSRRLADPRTLDRVEAEELIRTTPATVLVTCNIHSTEIASSQMAMEWAWALATASDDETRRRLSSVVLLLVPSLNPDGQIMEVEWYREWLGTEHEASPMPRLYHHYVGHDNNRDWFMLTQKETRAMSRAIYHRWFPQIFVDEHQMGSEGPRMFIPPFADPIDPDVDPLIWREINLIGSQMAFRLEQQEKSGVISGYGFDGYWVGGTRNTGWWKNITGLLLEVASARMATPIYLHPTDLEGGRKGLVEYDVQANHPNPWRGGWWRLRDIIDYERIASDALHEIAADRGADFLRNIYARASKAIAAASPREAYLLPARQRDYPTALRLATLLADHNVDVLRASNGDIWIPLAQPYGRFIREMMEPQRYPEVRLARDADPLAPYDVTTWSLPLMMGVESRLATMPAHLDADSVPSRFEAADRIVDAPAVSADWVAVERTSPESARVVNAALRAGGQVWELTEPATDVVQAPVPVRISAGSWIVDRRGAEAASSIARQYEIALIPLARKPGDLRQVKRPRIGIYKPFAPSMDEGWTRWLLEQYGFDVRSLENPDIRKGSLRRSIDVLILPDVDHQTIAEGRSGGSSPDEAQRYRRESPPAYRGGLGADGSKAIQEFVAQGGTLVALDSSIEWVTRQFRLPVRNAVGKLPRNELNIPGTLLKVHVDGSHPVSRGLPAEMPVFVDDHVALATDIPGEELKRSIIAWYPDTASEIPVSGWISGAEHLRRRAAAVAFEKGKGKIALFAFRPQHRAQTHAAFPFLFNAMYWGQ